MSYLDRLKRKISEMPHRVIATEGTKAPSVPFVALPPTLVPNISRADNQHVVDAGDFEERAAIMEYDGGLSRDEAQREAMKSFIPANDSSGAQ